MAKTYEPIATTTLVSGQTTIDFTGISQAYTDLVLVINSTSTGSTNINLQVGDGSIDTGSNYSFTYLEGNGSTAASGGSSNQNSIYCGAQSSTVRQTTIIQIQNYSNTTTFKTILSRGSLQSYSSAAVVGLWRSTSKIQLLRLLTGNYATDSTFTLYGIQAA